MDQVCGESKRLKFSIDKSLDTCKTPSNNDDTAAAVAQQSTLGRWAEQVSEYLKTKLFTARSTQ